MKKLIIIVLLLSAFLIGCEKEEKQLCWLCQTIESAWAYEYTLSGTYIGKYIIWQVTGSKMYYSKDGWTQNRIEREVEMNTDDKKIRCIDVPCPE